MVRPRILVCFGTRPEAIKLAPVIEELRSRGLDVIACSLGQHRELLDSVFEVFDLRPDISFDVMERDQDLTALTARILGRMREVLQAFDPDVLVVQGDTTSAMSAALAAYQCEVPIAHVEAGLRTSTLESPWPEEANRRLITRLANVHFTPTDAARANLESEGISSMTVVTVGNTGIDAASRFRDASLRRERKVLVTCHRRENHRDEFARAGSFLGQLAGQFRDHKFLWPTHPSPRSSSLAAALANVANLEIVPPLSYPDLLREIQTSMTVVTDSGGIQEECAYLGTPCLVMRDETDRPESVASGNAIVVGFDIDAAVESFHRTVEPSIVFGDGRASSKIADELVRLFTPRNTP